MGMYPTELLLPSYVGVFDGEFKLKSFMALAIYKFVERNFEAVSVAIGTLLMWTKPKTYYIKKH